MSLGTRLKASYNSLIPKCLHNSCCSQYRKWQKLGSGLEVVLLSFIECVNQKWLPEIMRTSWNVTWSTYWCVCVMGGSSAPLFQQQWTPWLSHPATCQWSSQQTLVQFPWRHTFWLCWRDLWGGRWQEGWEGRGEGRGERYWQGPGVGNVSAITAGYDDQYFDNEMPIILTTNS